MNYFSMSEYKKFLNWEKPGALLAWINIVLFLPLIFPLGIYCYWKRNKVDKTASLHTWKIFLLCGIMMTITAFTLIARSGSVPMSLFLGLALIGIGIYRRRIAFVRMDIIGCLLVGREFNVRNISLAIKKSEKVVHNEIDNMIKSGMLPGVRVSYDTNEVYVPGYSGDGMDEYVAKAMAEEEGVDVETVLQEKAAFETEEEVEAYSDLKRKNNIKNHPLYTGICAACGEKMSEEAIANQKCNICGRVYEKPEEDSNYF